MGIVQRFERKLQGAVGDAFARVFGGGVVPQEVEAALQQEARDRVEHLGGGILLAPNHYVITINNSDHEELAADRDLTIKAFSRHLQDFIRDQGWQTYGDISVTFEPSPTLHTGQFRTRGTVDPDDDAEPASPRSNVPQVSSRPPQAPPQAPQQRPAPIVPPVSNPVPSQPGAGTMTQNSGYESSREPAGRQPDQQPARNGYSHDDSGSAAAQGGGYPAPQGQGAPPQNGYDRGDGYRTGDDQQAYPNQNLNQAPNQQGYEQQGYQQPYNDQQAYQGSYDQQGYTQQPYNDQQAYQQPYNDQAYQQQAYQGGYEQQGYDQQGYDQQGYDQNANPQQPYNEQQAYQQPYNDQAYNQQPYDAQSYDQGSYDQGANYDQTQSYAQQSYNQGGYAPAAQQALTATLQLEDGSGRHFQLRDGSNIIGRGQEAQFRLPDTGVSRRHIDIRWDGRTAMLSDLGSTNGTTVNGAPVQDWQLADGDIVRAGHSEILVRIL
ncbi:DUF3662 and FHA domain-containing protein [Rhodococcus sp. OK302]|uniref:DUF3662 and FHA domain-containing protein n=1 Tax=Rhodococcus sp. OK302 TaxID=1882769 RepID=UPI000B93F98F|nr:DUF3662 and FHA domain-containing protein [Rhodococcus sp. OK302]OYD67427.1 FHA domain-containing protein [Rhodococcus sp. OK302]